jgi:hypothetical protein
MNTSAIAHPRFNYLRLVSILAPIMIPWGLGRWSVENSEKDSLITSFWL